MNSVARLETLADLSAGSDDENVKACAEAVLAAYGDEAVNAVLLWQHEASVERSDEAALVALRVINAIWDVEDSIKGPGGGKPS